MLDNLKEASKEEKKKLSEMTFKEKREYIWEYYKIHITLTVIFLIITGSIINNVFINPPKKAYLGFAFYDIFLSDELTSEMRSTLNENLVKEEDKDTLEVQMSTFPIRSEDPQMSMASIQKFAAMIAVKELDIVISTEEAFMSLAGEGYFLDMTELPGISYPAEDMLSAVTEESGTEDPFGIPVRDISFFTENGFTSQDMNYYLGVIVNTERRPETIEAINYCLEFTP